MGFGLAASRPRLLEGTAGTAALPCWQLPHKAYLLLFLDLNLAAGRPDARTLWRGRSTRVSETDPAKSWAFEHGPGLHIELHATACEPTCKPKPACLPAGHAVAVKFQSAVAGKSCKTFGIRSAVGSWAPPTAPPLPHCHAVLWEKHVPCDVAVWQDCAAD